MRQNHCNEMSCVALMQYEKAQRKQFWGIIYLSTFFPTLPRVVDAEELQLLLNANFPPACKRKKK